jgi:PAS domain-containing protein
MNDRLNKLSKLHSELFDNQDDEIISGGIKAHCASIKQIESNLINEYKTIINSLPMCIHEISIDGRILKMNPAGLRMLNVIDESDVIGDRYMSYVHEDDKPRVYKLLISAISDGKPSCFEYKSPTNKYFSSCFVPIFKNNNVEKLVGYTHDTSKYYESR